MDQLLQSLTAESALFPLRLKCVYARQDALGKTVYADYAKHESKLDESGRTSASGRRPNNQARLYYLDSVLSPAEWKLFFDLVEVYPYITEKQTERYLQALRRFCPRKDLQVGKRWASKCRNQRQFANLELLDAAIRQKKKVRLEYGEYRLEQNSGRWVPTLEKRLKHGEMHIEPYATLWSNGYYYLVAKWHGLMLNLRADRILSVEIMDESFELPPDFNPAVYREQSPVMYPGQPHFIRMRCKTELLNTLLDFFGSSAQFTKPDSEGWTELTMQASLAGVRLFALQYADSVELLEPVTLREELASSLRASLARYEQTI